MRAVVHGKTNIERYGVGQWLFAVAFACVCGGAWAQPSSRVVSPEIEYGYPDQSIFVATVNAKGQPDSPMTKLAEAVLMRAGIPWHPAPYPAPRLYRNLQDGTTRFSILVRAPQLESCCLFSRNPVYRTELNAYFIGAKAPVAAREELAGKRVITIRGYSYGGLLQFINDPANRVENEVAPTHKAAFEMLAAGRGDYVIDYASAAREILAESPVRDLRHRVLDRLEIHLVLSRAYPDAEVVMSRLEAIVHELKVDDILIGRRR
jgi:ABC-type amino acid transport substrate-binding protein